MKRIPSPFSCAMTLFLLLTGSACTKKPVPDFTSDRTTVTAGESVQFTDRSTNEPSRWNWTFDGGSPSASREQNPLVTYNTPGSYRVSLEAARHGDGEILTRDNYIMVTDPNTDVRFINRTHTTIDIMLGGIEKSVPSGDSVTYMDVEGDQVNVTAQTSGEDAGGDPIGLTLYWDFDVQLNGGTNRNNMNISTDFFFLYLTNNGTHELSPIEVYDSDGEPWVEDGFYIPTDGVTYHIGYYNAYEYTQVRAYYQDSPDYYTYWDNNTHFFFTDEVNQSISLSNQYKKSAVIQDMNRDHSFRPSPVKQVSRPLPAVPVTFPPMGDENTLNRYPVRGE